MLKASGHWIGLTLIGRRVGTILYSVSGRREQTDGWRIGLRHDARNCSLASNLKARDENWKCDDHCQGTYSAGRIFILLYRYVRVSRSWAGRAAAASRSVLSPSVLNSNVPPAEIRSNYVQRIGQDRPSFSWRLVVLRVARKHSIKVSIGRDRTGYLHHHHYYYQRRLHCHPFTALTSHSSNMCQIHFIYTILRNVMTAPCRVLRPVIAFNMWLVCLCPQLSFNHLQFWRTF